MNETQQGIRSYLGRSEDRLKPNGNKGETTQKSPISRTAREPLAIRSDQWMQDGHRTRAGGTPAL